MTGRTSALDGLVETPWDRRVFGFATYEITKASESLFQTIRAMPGHFTLRVDPLTPKGLLHQYGFYYCDTLIEPYCAKEKFRPVFDVRVAAEPGFDPERAAAMCQGVFQYDRFHRDFHIDPAKADARYAAWVREIAASGRLYGLWFKGKAAGFFGCQGNKLALHAVVPSFQGRGLAKFFWSAVCQTLFEEGHAELVSSVSAANAAVVNLYRSLGFSFRNPRDIYHLFNPPDGPIDQATSSQRICPGDGLQYQQISGSKTDRYQDQNRTILRP